VCFNNLSFCYNENEPLIENLSLTAKHGDTVAIVGKTGAGKTTLVNLLMGFYRVQKGEITIDGININSLEKDNMYGVLGMVLQDTWLFSGTIYENVAYGKEGATMEEVIEACKAAKAHGFIKRMPKGYDTLLNEEGSNVSAGQKQLLTIARALLKDPEILILDEATSSVDTRTESLIQKAMDELKKGRTSFVIAHRLSTIKNADEILVMDKGKIVEKGNHKQLMALGGYYATLYNSQFE
ncbi:MAG: ATP-binding cassette domain-containing protein, partial [Clostridia bacterium]|nr:ATP-binding cassette domain-containing protein [Clostridia bacterium]